MSIINALFVLGMSTVGVVIPASFFVSSLEHPKKINELAVNAIVNDFSELILLLLKER